MAPYKVRSVTTHPTTDPDPRERHRKKTLDLSLLLVNKQINREATKVLYTEAHFELASGWEFIHSYTRIRRANKVRAGKLLSFQD